ncbi:IS630 family transposase [Streptomyces phaeochromogenes]|uniref:IS630 family transposase n=1 Tax=Streptomyces phaeochromogenes TaxID=1923 RepID=UPI00386DB367
MGGGKTTRAACRGWICFEREAGFTRRPSTGRIWDGAPRSKVNDRGSGRVSVAGMIAMRPGSRTRLCRRLRRHTERKGERRRLSEHDYIALVDGVHQLLKAPIVLVWARLNTRVSHKMRDLTEARARLTVFTLPAYAREPNAVECLWAYVKHSLANLSSVALDRLAALVRNRLKRLQYRPDAPRRLPRRDRTRHRPPAAITLKRFDS